MDDINETNPAPAPGFSIGGNVGGMVIQGNGNIVNAGSPPVPVEPPYEPQMPPAPGELPEPGTLPPGSRIHAERNKNFTGREADLLALANALVYALQPGALTITQTIAGLGGIGKSQLAVEFCYRYGRFFKSVRWLDARQSLEVEIAACGAKMDLLNWPKTTPEQLSCTLNAWQRAPHRLLVLDNLEESEILRKWKPELEGMSLLVTSRNPTWDTDLTAVRRLDVLARPESLLLLRRLALRLETIPDNELDPLAERLGDLPLALDLAGRYLKDRSLTPQQYLEKLRETALKHPSLKAPKAGSPTRHDTDVELTFLLSWEQLQDDPCDALAKRFFIAAGYLAPNVPIPRDVFYWLALPDNWRKKEIKTPDDGMQEGTEEALLRLLSIGLLNEALTIHPLLAEFARARDADNATILSALADRMTILSHQANQTGLPANFILIRPHLEVLAPIAKRAKLANSGVLWNNLGYHLRMTAEYPAARAAYERALVIDEKMLGLEHLDVAIDVNNLGCVLRDMGDLPGAKAHYERALAIWEKQLGAAHPQVALAVNNLGLILKSIGDQSGAKIYFERALAIKEKQLGAEHPDMATTFNNLGLVLKNMGDQLDAKAYFERALAIWEKHLGPEHPKVAFATNNLGSVLKDMGDLLGAKAYYERALAIDEKVYGKEHPEVAMDLHNIATLLADMDDLPQALALEKCVLAMFQKFLPPEHLYIQNARRSLAEIEHRISEMKKSE